MFASSAWSLALLSLLDTGVQALSSNDSGSNIRPYTINVDPSFLEETRAKVSTFRPSVDINAPAWFDGPPVANMTALAKYWANDYDWLAEQSRINSNFSHYMASVPSPKGTYNDSTPLDIHFIHQRSKRADAIPMLMLHGWPSTSLEWEKVIPDLVDPEDDKKPAFHIIAPDLPGFGFSPAPKATGLGPAGHSAVFASLMKQLGYERYVLYSTDLGTVVAMSMIVEYAAEIINHVTDFYMAFPNDSDTARLAANQTTAEENAYIASMSAFLGSHSAYSSLHSTYPLSIAYALNDSPVGFLAWVYHIAFTVNGEAYAPSDIITQAFLLYLPGVYGNIRSYKELFGTANFAPKKNFTVPTSVLQFGYAQAGDDYPYPEIKSFEFVPRKWVERTANVTYFQRHQTGGHFPAVSVPKLVIEDLRAIFA